MNTNLYIARDKNGFLGLYTLKPEVNIQNGEYQVQDNFDMHVVELPSTMFENITFDDGIVCVDIVPKDKNAYKIEEHTQSYGGLTKNYTVKCNNITVFESNNISDCVSYIKAKQEGWM